jgi:hypothetical protein
MEEQTFIEGSLRERTYLPHQVEPSRAKPFFAGDLDELLEAAIEGVGLWDDVDARDRLSVDVDGAGLFRK